MTGGDGDHDRHEAGLSAAARAASSSAIRDLLRHADRPDLISLAGGIPAPHLFPSADVAAIAARRLGAGDGLQYGLTEGELALRERIVELHAAEGDEVRPDDVLVTTGSQQALDLVGRVLVDPGDEVVVGDPLYVGALQALRFQRPRLVAVPVDGHGLDVDALAACLADGVRPKLVHVVPNFDNPTGAELAVQRRQQLAMLADRYGFLIVEDDPYARLRFDGSPLPGLAAFTDRVIRLRSTSKIVAPGLRVGWLVGPPWLVQAATIAKQAVDLHTSTASQVVLADLLARPGWLDTHIATLVPWYRAGRDTLVASVEAHLPDAAFTRPTGGMFVWLRLPGIDTSALLPAALDAGVAYVPGAAFAVNRDLHDHLRLSFATASPDELGSAVRRLATVVRVPPGADVAQR